MKSFYYLGDRLNASGGSEAAVTARTRIGWIKFREWRVALWEKVFVRNERKGLLEFVRSAMLQGSETWCLRENEMTILKRAQKGIMRAMCGVKLMEKKGIKNLRICWV